MRTHVRQYRPSMILKNMQNITSSGDDCFSTAHCVGDGGDSYKSEPDFAINYDGSLSFRREQ